jgi:hypothetical protein
MRGLIALLAVLFLAGCQQLASQDGHSPRTADSADASPSSSEFDTMPQEHTSYFEAEAKDLRAHLAADLTTDCYRHLGSSEDFDKCSRAGIVKTFDDSGEGNPNCSKFSGLDAFADCVVTGNAILDAANRLSGPSKPDPKFWTNRRTMDQAFIYSVVKGGTDTCGKFTEKSALLTCIDRWLQSRLELPQQLMSKCPSEVGGDDRGRCLGEAFMVKFMQEHIGRLSTLGI